MCVWGGRMCLIRGFLGHLFSQKPNMFLFCFFSLCRTDPVSERHTHTHTLGVCRPVLWPLLVPDLSHVHNLLYWTLHRIPVPVHFPHLSYHPLTFSKAISNSTALFVLHLLLLPYYYRIITPIITISNPNCHENRGLKTDC